MVKIILALGLTLFSGAAFAAPIEKLNGSYDVQTQIGDRLFHDQLQLVVSPEGGLSGTLTVTGVFSAEVSGAIQTENESAVLYFSILAHENNQDFKVNYRAEVTTTEPVVLTGQARLENGDLLGNFTAYQK